MTTLLVSDIHLRADAAATTERFLAFLHDHAARTEALYILGDLFEYWIGDDAPLPGAERIIEALREVVDCGVTVSVMHGNRDFLLGEAFSARSGCRLLPDPSVVVLHGEPTLLTHGDLLCTADRDHLAFRAMVDDHVWRTDFLSRPISERRSLAEQLRQYSRQGNREKEEEIMDVTPAAVADAMRRHGVAQLIHGHTHREGTHQVSLASGEGRRIVLGDWHPERGSALLCDHSGCRFIPC